MNRYYIITPPYSERLWEETWFYECIPYDEFDRRGIYLAPEHKVNELFGRYHNFKLYDEKQELLHAEYGYNPHQLRIEFPD